jgi:hypothetical protein
MKSNISIFCQFVGKKLLFFCCKKTLDAQARIEINKLIFFFSAIKVTRQGETNYCPKLLRCDSGANVTGANGRS